MEVGMMWFDDAKKPLPEKITEAAAYYEKKYGLRANQVHVHPGQDVPEQLGDVRVVQDKAILKGHLWVGVERRGG